MTAAPPPEVAAVLAEVAREHVFMARRTPSLGTCACDRTAPRTVYPKYEHTTHIAEAQAAALTAAGSRGRRHEGGVRWVRYASGMTRRHAGWSTVTSIRPTSAFAVNAWPLLPTFACPIGRMVHMSEVDPRGIVAATIESVLWAIDEDLRNAFASTAHEVQLMLPDDACCALSEEIVCDEGCPMKAWREEGPSDG